jgi:26S proteasome regulatory subunit N5
MADIQVLKPDRDYSKEVDEQLPQAEELAKVLQRARYLLIT